MLEAVMVIAAAFAFCVSIGLAARKFRGIHTSEQVNEVVATLASGQVTIIQSHDGILIAAVGTAFEPHSLPPLIVPLGERDAAVILGAAEWTEPPPANLTLLRLDQKLPRLIHGLSGNAPSLRAATNASHLDQLGLAALEPLREVARNLRAQLHLPENLPLAEVVLIRSTEDQPLLVGDISYWIHQTFLQENFWDTEIERPRSTELYPTRENHSGLVEVHYPPDDHSPGLIAWLAHPTDRLKHAIERAPELLKAQREIADHETKKAKMAELVSLVKMALDIMVPVANSRAMLTLDKDGGFAWIIEPPTAKTPIKRPLGAPTLQPNPHSQ